MTIDAAVVGVRAFFTADPEAEWTSHVSVFGVADVDFDLVYVLLTGSFVTCSQTFLDAFMDPILHVLRHEFLEVFDGIGHRKFIPISEFLQKKSKS